MDNTNNGWPNNPTPTPSYGTPPPQPNTSAVPSMTVPTAAGLSNPAPSSWPSAPIQSGSATSTPPLPSFPMPTTQPDPATFISPTPVTPTPTPADSTWTPPVPQPAPDYSQPASGITSQNPTFPQSTDTSPISSTPSLINGDSHPLNGLPSSEPPMTNGLPQPTNSPLDNPWGAPVQPPAIDGSALLNSQPTLTWPQTPTNDLASGMGTSSAPEPAAPTDSIPTDLSHLISGNNPIGNAPPPPAGEAPPPNTTETLVIPSTAGGTPDIPTVPTEGRKGMPKWLIGVGIGLLIMVAGASAYFILGIGQSPKTTTSVPAEVTDNKPSVKTPPPIATPPQSSPATAATDSANFGSLDGTGPARTPIATSAAEIIKQRTQQKK